MSAKNLLFFDCETTGKADFRAAPDAEAYQHATGKPLVDAHDALADVRACKEVYFYLQGLKAQVVA